MRGAYSTPLTLGPTIRVTPADADIKIEDPRSGMAVQAHHRQVHSTAALEVDARSGIMSTHTILRDPRDGDKIPRA